MFTGSRIVRSLSALALAVPPLVVSTGFTTIGDVVPTVPKPRISVSPPTLLSEIGFAVDVTYTCAPQAVPVQLSVSVDPEVGGSAGFETADFTCTGRPVTMTVEPQTGESFVDLGAARTFALIVVEDPFDGSRRQVVAENDAAVLPAAEVRLVSLLLRSRRVAAVLETRCHPLASGPLLSVTLAQGQRTAGVVDPTLTCTGGWTRTTAALEDYKERFLPGSAQLWVSLVFDPVPANAYLRTSVQLVAPPG